LAFAVPTQVGGQPVLILKEGSTRRTGNEAVANSVLVAKVIRELLRTSLGPRGMEKMLIGTIGDATVTKSGVTILGEANIEHPIAKMVVEASKSQDKEAGDGTTSVALLACELIGRAEELFRKKIHRSTITSGYHMAGEMAVEGLKRLAIKVDTGDEKALRRVAETTLNTLLPPEKSGLFAEIAVKAVQRVLEKRGERLVADPDDIQIVKKVGRGTATAELVEGIILDKEVVHPNMPKSVENARIVLLDFPLEIEKTEITAEVEIDSPEKLRNMMGEERKALTEKVNKVLESGANMAVCQKGIDEEAQHILAKNGVLAVRRVKRSDMEKLARASKARILSTPDEASKEALGSAGLAEERKIGEDKVVVVERCLDPKSVSVLLRGETEKHTDEHERAMKSTLAVVAGVCEKGLIVPGGGAVEIEVAKNLRRRAEALSGGQQLAVQAFAEALEEIPVNLAENAGQNPVEAITRLRAAHKTKAQTSYGIDLTTGRPVDMVKKGVVEPFSVKERYIKAATEVANMILRIDDIIAAGKPPEKK